MNHLLDVIAEWMQREQSASIYLAICVFVAFQTFMICGR